LEDIVKKMLHVIIGAVGFLIVLMVGLVMAQTPQPQNLSRAVIKIDSLSCGGCFSTINSGLSPLEGYSGMGANLFRKLIAIDFEAPLTAEKISQMLTKVGYPGKIEYVDAISEKESFAYLESKRTGFNSGGGSCCSGGSLPAGSSPGNPGSSTGIAPSGGSCCTLPGVSQSTEDL
jgi:copper chaperone CopZ